MKAMLTTYAWHYQSYILAPDPLKIQIYIGLSTYNSNDY